MLTAASLPHPTSVNQIAQAKRKTEEAKELEGIDTSNIMQGSRRRGRSDNLNIPNKKRRSADERTGGSAGDDSQGSRESGCSSGENSNNGGGDEDSESEFEFSG